MALRYPFRTKSTSTTTGTGSYTLGEPNTPGWRTLTQAVAAGDLADGDTVYYLAFDATADVGAGGKLLELGLGTWNNTTKVLARTTVIQPNATAVSWGAGTRNILIVSSPAALLHLANNLSDLASAATARTNLGLGTVATFNVGTGANNIPQLNGSSQLPAVDGSLLTGMKIPQGVRVTADQTVTASVALVDATGLTFNVSAGVTYSFFLQLYVSATSTGGYKFSMQGTATMTAYIARATLMKETATTFAASDRATAFPSTHTQLNAAGTEDAYVEIMGTFTVNAGGTVKLQFAQNSAAGTTILRRGSTFGLQIIS